MRRFVAAVMAGGVALLGAGAAAAQQPEDEGMNCVYDALVEDYELVAEVFLYDDVTQEEIDAADRIIEAAMKGCAERYTLSEGQLFTIGELGVYASAIDYLAEELLWSGATEAAVNGVLDVYDGLGDDDIDMLFDTTWRSNVAFHDKLKGAVVAKGIPSDGDAVALALRILEVAAMSEEAVVLFDLDKLLREDDAP